MKQVLSIEQMQHLEELGLNIEINNSSLFRCEWEEGAIFNFDAFNEQLLSSSEVNMIPCYSLQDILDLLPATIDDDYRLYIDKGLVFWTVGYVDAVSEEIYEDFRERDLIDTAYEMLCWIIKNNYLNIKE